MVCSCCGARAIVVALDGGGSKRVRRGIVPVGSGAICAECTRQAVKRFASVAQTLYEANEEREAPAASGHFRVAAAYVEEERVPG
jgi:hypothetical protein